MTETPEVVLDASALLAFLHDEPGGDRVEPLLERAAISSVNWAEVMQRSIAASAAVDGLREDLESLGLSILPFTPEDAETTARLWPSTRELGLSFGDRACLALALRQGLPAFTADQVWEKAQVGAQIVVVR